MSSFRSALLTLASLFPSFGADASADSTTLVQTLEFVAEPSPRLRMSVRCDGAQGGDTTWAIQKEWGGHGENWREIQDVRAFDRDGAEVELTHPDPWIWRARHAPGATLLSGLEVSLELVPGHRFEVGFDTITARESGRVSGVREDSAAHDAGVRDGQEVLGWSIENGRTDREIELNVRESGERRTIRWYPRGEEVFVPRYVRAP